MSIPFPLQRRRRPTLAIISALPTPTLKQRLRQVGLGQQLEAHMSWEKRQECQPLSLCFPTLEPGWAAMLPTSTQGPRAGQWTHSASLPGMKAQGGQHLRESSQIHSEAEKHSSTERAREDYRPLCFNVLKQIFGLPSPSKCHGVWGALGIWHVPPTSPHQLSVQLSIPPVNTTAWIVVVCPESPAQSSLPERDMQSYDGQL